MAEVAHVIALETKTRGIRQILSPVLNIARDVRWGRTEETYGEDPFLTSRMGVAFISEFENLGVITTPKHYIANVGDGGRNSYPIHYNERLMDEVYLPAFKAAFQEAGAWSGTLLSPASGRYKIGFKGDDGYRLYIDDKLVINNWRKQSFRQLTTDYFFVKGREYKIRIEFYETIGNAHIKLIWNLGVVNQWERNISEAVYIAKRSDAAVIVAGIEEGEFRDRAFLNLPGHQEELIRAVAACGKPLVVVLTGGSAITMSSWIDEADAVLDVWYPGDAGGSAVAKILFGDYNPAGRLPITFPIHEAQLPLYYNHKPTGRGDDYLNLSGKPLFPFGFGLSYTNFTYSDLQLSDQEINTKQSINLSFTLSNTGKRDGDEVVQLYIKDIIASVARPIFELKGFQRIHVKARESKKVDFKITPDLLSMLNKKLDALVEPGEFRIMIGAASNDIRLRETFTVN